MNQTKRSTGGHQEVMTCFECGSETLKPSRVCVDGERNGETFPVRLQGYKCESCGFQTIDSHQSAEFTRLVSDAYRTVHNYLTSVELRERRKRLGMNQRQFAEYLPAGVASVRRWEAGHIQDRAMDQLIRLRTDPEAARTNLRTLELQFPEPLVVFEGEGVSLAMTVAETQYMEQSTMIIEKMLIPEQEVGSNACIAA